MSTFTQSEWLTAREAAAYLKVAHRTISFHDWHQRGTVFSAKRCSGGVAVTTYCILCRSEIQEKRARRGPITCCSDHGQEYRRQRRSERATKFCRLWGRKARRPKAVTPVPVEHSAIGEQA
jgi:hypothetical protein